jgi:hypothetical protein
VTTARRLVPQSREDGGELAYQRSLSTAQRFEMMLARSRQIAEELILGDHASEPVPTSPERP